MPQIHLTIPMIMALDDCFATVSFTGKPTLDVHTGILGKIKDACVDSNNYKEGTLDLTDAELAHMRDCVVTVVNTKIPGKLALGYSAMLAAVETKPITENNEKA